MKICKKLCISILAVFATACLSLGIVLSPTVKASAETPQLASSLTMKYGASVRINKTERYEDNGIRFSATISDAEYNVVRLMDNAVFGMFIMPESYLTRFGDLTAENVNAGGVYDWKENKSNDYFYGGSEMQAESHRILAMTYTELPDDTNNDGYKVINGSVVAIKDDNLDMNYVGRAFIRYEVDGFYFYEMADWSEGYAKNNVRSVTEVAEKALEDTNSNLTANEQKALSDAYLIKSLTVDGYTAINSAEEFAAMNANGKYYLAKDITISAAYTNEFSGSFNGNGKKITANGTSVFSTFTGTLENVEITTNASVISSLNSGLVDGITVNYTYSEAAANVIAASSQKIARVENCILYTDNNATAFVADAGAFVSNCVETTDTTAKYKEIVFATENGKVTKLIKEGATISNKFIYGAESSLVGSVTAWNKEFATVTSDDTYYATESETVYDATAEWEKLANSAINGTAVNVDTPYGYETVHGGNREWTTASISGYTSVRFAAKMSGYFLLKSDWSIYSDANDWMQVTMDKQEDGTWTITVDGPIFNGSAWVNSYQKTDVTATTLAEAMSFVSYGYTTYATEVYGIAEESSNLDSFEVVGSAMSGTTVAEGETAPEGFTKVSTRTIAAADKGSVFADVDVSEYSELTFAFKSSSWMLFDGWAKYTHQPDVWVTVLLVNNFDNTWTVTASGSSHTLTYTGTTLKTILQNWYNDGSATFYTTELVGFKPAVPKSEPYGIIIDDCVVTTSATLDETATAPNGFEYVYALSGAFTKTGKSTTDISNYSEIRFGVKATKYFLINGWTIYFKESYTDWATVVIVNNGNNAWTVSVYADVFIMDGSQVHNPYVVEYTGTSVNEILAKWESSGSTVYVTELRGVKSGIKSDVKVSNLICDVAYATTDVTAPAGYDQVYRKDGLEKGDFATIDLSSYSEVNFQIQSSSWILYGSWAGYVQTPNKWIAVRLVKQAGNSWSVFVNGTEEKTLTYTGTTLNEVLVNWYNDKDATFYMTELRGVHGTYEASQIKAIAMAKSDKTTQTKKAALELSNIIKELTGVELLIEYYDNPSELDANRIYLVLGTLAASEVDADLLTTETGYIMKKVGNHVVLYATTSDGMYNAAYGFLNTYFGVEFYTDGVMTYTDDNPIIGGAETVVFNPSIEYAWAVDGLLTDGADNDYNWAYVNRLGYSNLYAQIGGGTWHNFLTVISEEKYGESGTVTQNPEWFVTRKDADNQSFTTLNIAGYGDAIAVAVANEFAALINQNSTIDVWQFSAPDRNDAAFTSNDYVAFMNKVAANLNGQISRKVNLMLLAYNSTFAAPTTALAPQTNVGFTVMVAPIGMNYYYGFDNTTFTDSNGHTNAWYLEQITAWGDKADELFVWNYSVYFDNYFVPLDTITNMQSKYQAYVNAGATGIYDQGSGEANATDWAELKVYLKAELAKNVNADVDALIESFMKAYYGEAAAPYMLQLLNAQQSHYATIADAMRGGHMTRDSLFDKSYWGTSSSNAMLTEWYGYIQSALNATSDATLKARIHKEGLTIRYLNQVLFNYSGTKKTLTVTTVAGANATDSLEQIITDAKALGITRFAEGQAWICNDGTFLGTNNLVDGAIDNLA